MLTKQKNSKRVTLKKKRGPEKRLGLLWDLSEVLSVCWLRFNWQIPLLCVCPEAVEKGMVLKIYRVDK